MARGVGGSPKSVGFPPDMVLFLHMLEWTGACGQQASGPEQQPAWRWSACVHAHVRAHVGRTSLWTRVPMGAGLWDGVPVRGCKGGDTCWVWRHVLAHGTAPVSSFLSLSQHPLQVRPSPLVAAETCHLHLWLAGLGPHQ